MAAMAFERAIEQHSFYDKSNFRRCVVLKNLPFIEILKAGTGGER